MSEKMTMRVGESLVAGGPAGTAAEPEVIIGELDGPFGTAFANLLGDQAKGHSKVLAIMNTDIMVKPATLMVSKVSVDNTRYTNILMGTVQGAIANGVLDSVRDGTIDKNKANDLGIIVSVWLNPSVSKDDNLDHKILFDIIVPSRITLPIPTRAMSSIVQACIIHPCPIVTSAPIWH